MTIAQDRAEALYAARRDRSPIEPFTDTDPDMTAHDASAVQTRFDRHPAGGDLPGRGRTRWSVQRGPRLRTGRGRRGAGGPPRC